MSEVHREAVAAQQPVGRISLGGKIALAALLGMVAVFVLAGMGEKSGFHGQNNQLYATLKAHGSTMSNDQADALVNRIAETGKLSHAEALKAAVAMAGSGR